MFLAASAAAVPTPLTIDQAVVSHGNYDTFTTRAIGMIPVMTTPDPKMNWNFESSRGFSKRGICFGKECSKTSDPSVPSSTELSQQLLDPNPTPGPRTSSESTRSHSSSTEQKTTRKLSEQSRQSPTKICNQKPLPKIVKRASSYISNLPPSAMFVGNAPSGRILKASGHSSRAFTDPSHDKSKLIRRGACYGKSCKNGPSPTRNPPRYSASSEMVPVGSSLVDSSARHSTQAMSSERSGASQRSKRTSVRTSPERRRTGVVRPDFSSTSVSDVGSDRASNARSPTQVWVRTGISSAGSSSTGSPRIAAFPVVDPPSPPPSPPPPTDGRTHRYNDSINMLYGEPLRRPNSIDSIYGGS